MKIVVCVDDNNGILFNKRRISSDLKVLEDIISNNNKLVMTEYSYKLFIEKFPELKNIFVCSIDKITDDFKDELDDIVYFVEQDFNVEFASNADEIIIYKWNRKYPSDTKLSFVPQENGWNLKNITEFSGNSHDKINKEVYRTN